jgi:predicted AAA+ superfamily ATPase
MSTPLGRSSSARFMLLDVLVIGGAASFFADREIEFFFFKFRAKKFELFSFSTFFTTTGTGVSDGPSFIE